MRRIGLQGLCTVLCIFGISTASAEVISINFDTDTSGAVVPAGTNLTTDATYEPWGVSFSRVGGTLCGPDVYANSNHPGDFGTLPNVVSTCRQGISSDISAPSFGQVRAEFTVPASQVCIDVRPGGLSHGANLAAHELGGVLVDSQNSTLGVTETLCVNGMGISYVLFNGPGVGFARFDNLVVTTDGVAAPTYTVGGTVSGLTGSVTLQNNGGDDIIKTTNDGFTFTAQAEGSDYAVTLSSQPSGQTCAVTNGSGTNITADITNVTVTCVTDVVPTYSVGGTVSGLTGTGLALQNNGGDTLPVAAAATGFIFATELADAATYAVTVSTQPTGQTCSISSGSGTIATADVANVTVDCADEVVAPPPAPMVPIPAMSEWALILLTMLIGLMVFANRRRLF